MLRRQSERVSFPQMPALRRQEQSTARSLHRLAQRPSPRQLTCPRRFASVEDLVSFSRRPTLQPTISTCAVTTGNMRPNSCHCLPPFRIPQRTSQRHRACPGCCHQDNCRRRHSIPLNTMWELARPNGRCTARRFFMSTIREHPAATVWTALLSGNHQEACSSCSLKGKEQSQKVDSIQIRTSSLTLKAQYDFGMGSVLRIMYLFCESTLSFYGQNVTASFSSADI